MAQKKELMDFIEMCEQVNKVLGYDQRNAGKHFHPNSGNFEDWCNSKKLPEIDPEGKHRGSSQVWYAEYQKDILLRNWSETPYYDFWHWQLDNSVPCNFRNDSNSTLCIDPDLVNLHTPRWVKVIHKVWISEFSEYADENFMINIKVSW
jgi:hypothetical protein